MPSLPLRINLLPQEVRPTPNLGGGPRFITPALSRFMSKVNKRGPVWNGTNCWQWLGVTNKNGYGHFNPTSTTTKKAYKWYWEFINGAIQPDKELDHLCKNTSCVNPDHLEPVTHMENLRRGVSFSGVNFRKTHCKNGHEFTPENTYTKKSHRDCWVCKRDRKKKYLARGGSDVCANESR